jgi:hypothetical protein
LYHEAQGKSSFEPSCGLLLSIELMPPQANLPSKGQVPTNDYCENGVTLSSLCRLLAVATPNGRHACSASSGYLHQDLSDNQRLMPKPPLFQQIRPEHGE